jgi:hypothetical protein
MRHCAWYPRDAFFYNRPSVTIIMKLLRHYQLDIIFYFLLALILTWVGFYLAEQFGRDPHDFEWAITLPLLTLYTLWLLRIRSHINPSENRRLNGKTFSYWILLGIIIFTSYATPLSASDFWSVNLLYLIFTLFLADSYWDFRALRLKNLFGRENLK